MTSDQENESNRKVHIEQSATQTAQARTQREQDKTRTEQTATGAHQAATQIEQDKTWTTEQALRASELSYRRLFEAAQDGILILEVDTGRITDVNPFLVKLLGFPHDEMIGKTVGELSPFKDIEENKVMLERLQNDGYVRYEDLPLETRDGRHIAVEFVSNVYQAGEKKVIQCNVRDITARKQAETALNRLASIVESSDDAIIGKDLNSIITSWNRGAEKIFGYAAGEMVGASIVRLIPADRQDEENQILEKVRRGESVAHFDTLRQTKDGRLINISVTASPIKDAAGKVTGVSKVARDITERRRTEQALRESEEHFRFLNALAEATRTLADPAQIMAVMARKLGEHLHASRCAYADVAPDGEQFTILHDYTDGCASTVGKYQLSLFGPRAVATLNRGQTLIIRNVEAELLPDEGADTFHAIGIQAIITCPLVKDGVLRAMMAVHQTTPRDWKPDEIAMVQNVVERCWATIERRAAEEKIHQLNTKLEHRVAQRTAQLKTVNEELEAFSYSVSHDLRAPLRHITGFVNLLQKDAGPSLSQKNLQYLTTISESAKRMGNLIDDLLSFSRVGRDLLQKTNINLDELLRAVLGEFEIEIKERNVIWEIHPLPPVQADHSLLRLALINLISNAVKFTSHRAEARIEIGCLPNDENETVIFVRDNGAGFDPKYVHKLFGVFQRLHSHAEFEGTGIGLANVQRIIQRHGGRVWAEGAVDRGATFYLSLPKTKEPALNVEIINTEMTNYVSA